MLRRLYDWTMAKAAHRRAAWWLALFAFVEASFFPIPPHPLLGLMCLRNANFIPMPNGLNAIRCGQALLA